mmetsp:Transcript_5963/g.13073  ORF Transcript_5963/g.13073 Transcript_5963/m.13073 type:complete len:212 (-) Transcript_5963:193-828(-)
MHNPEILILAVLSGSCIVARHDMLVGILEAAHQGIFVSVVVIGLVLILSSVANLANVTKPICGKFIVIVIVIGMVMGRRLLDVDRRRSGGGRVTRINVSVILVDQRSIAALDRCVGTSTRRTGTLVAVVNRPGTCTSTRTGCVDKARTEQTDPRRWLLRTGVSFSGVRGTKVVRHVFLRRSALSASECESESYWRSPDRTEEPRRWINNYN